jgi:hypothetical protein
VLSSSTTLAAVSPPRSVNQEFRYTGGGDGLNPKRSFVALERVREEFPKGALWTSTRCWSRATKIVVG